MLPLIAWLAGCPLLSDGDMSARFDVDGDGAPRPEDCDDLDPTVGPAGVWYADLDGDGFGSAASSPVCEGPAGYVAEGGDCDDANPLVNPNVVWFEDADGDGWGGTATTRACTQPRGYAATTGDCGDGDASVNPDAAETCDGRDEDCSGVADDPGVAEVCSDRLDNDCDGIVASCAVSGQKSLEAAPGRVMGDLDTPIDVLAPVGDLNGDGRADLVVGAPRTVIGDYDTSGLIAIFTMIPTGEFTVSSATAVIAGTDLSEGLGASFAGADIDGDGRTDLAVGAPGSDLVHLWFSLPADGTSGSADLSVYWERRFFGRRLSAAGDVDGDGQQDLVATASYKLNESGSENCCGFVGVIRGGDPAELWVDPEIIGQEASSLFGIGLAGGVDFDGDGLDDIAAGAPGHDGGRGAVYVFRGGFTGSITPEDADAQLSGAGGYMFGSEISAIPDCDGDGAPELLAADGGASRAVLFGSPLGSSAATTTFSDAGYGFGYDASDAGDVDGDALSDIVITNPYASGGDGKNDGAAYVFFSPIQAGTYTADDAGGTLRGPNGGGQAASSAGTLGDIDGDGFDDFYVLDQDYVYGSSDPGTAWLLFGGEG
jgi:hypothetical protein